MNIQKESYEQKRVEKMKSKLLPTIYRIFMILTFICGGAMMHFLFRLVIHDLDRLDVTDLKVANALSGLGYTFFGFIIMLMIGILLSIACFRAAKFISSLTRTLSMVLAFAVCVPAIEFMLQCIGVKDYYYTDIVEKASEKAAEMISGDFVLNSDTYQIFLPMPAFTIITILLITSVMALVSGPRLAEEELDENEEGEEGEEGNENEEENADPKAKKKKDKKNKKGSTERKRMTDNPEDAPPPPPPAEEAQNKKKSRR